MSTVIISTDQGSSEIRLQPSRNEASSRVVLLPLETAWAVLPAAYTAVGLGGAVVSEGDRRFGLGPATLPRRIAGERLSRFLDCGMTASLPVADAYAVTMQISTQLIAEVEGATRVLTLIEASARPRDTAGNPVPCTSNGQLERRIYDQIQAAAAR